VFTDATGAEYRLERIAPGNPVFAAHEGIYLWYDSGAQTLRFPDGSWWDMLAQSAALEADAGTRYPTAMHDTNGNSITLAYQAGAGSLEANTSARLREIRDLRGSTYYPTYQLSYTAGVAPHLTTISGPPGEYYTFTMAGQTVTSPFGGSGVTMQALQSVDAATGSHTFTYNGSGEMTKVVTPLGGDLRWTYRNYLYTGTGRTYREVTTRQMTKASGAAQANWNVTPADGAMAHGSTTVSDLGANSSKVWTFGSTGLVTSYEERGPGSVALAHADYTWRTDNGNVYVGTVVNTRNPGANQLQSQSTQALDSNGNLTSSAVYDYGNLATPARTYSYSYLTGTEYTNRYILNRVTQVTMTPAGGSQITLVTNTYDGYAAGVCSPVAGLTARTGLTFHDDTNYGVGMTYRGNLPRSVTVGGVQCVGYESTGVATGTMDGAGHYVMSAPAASTGYSLPGTLTPEGNAALATTVTYANSWAVTSVAGPNGATGSTAYDAYGRPAATTIADGASTGYSYANYLATGGAGNQQMATLGTRWKRTTLDGFGRVTKVETGNVLAPE